MRGNDFVWTYNEDRRAFERTDRRRVEFDYKHNPPGMVRVNAGLDRNAYGWGYRHWGETKEDCWDACTGRIFSDIAQLGVEADRLRDSIKRKFGERP